MMICYGFVKISIIAFYRRIFATNKRTIFDIVTKITMVVVFLWVITFILIIVFPCGIHVDANWGPPVQQLAYCQSIGYTSLEGLAGSDLILDVALIVLPIPIVSSESPKINYNRAVG